MHGKTLRIVSFMLMGFLTTSFVLMIFGSVAMAVEKTVIAEFECNGKHQITLEEVLQEISELPEYKQKKYADKSGLEEYMTLMSESRLILCLAKERNLDEDEEILKKVRNHLHKLMVDRITEIEIEEKLTLTEEDYRQYYEGNKEEYIDAEGVELSCITLTDGDRAKTVFEEIRNGKDIIEAATELSDHAELVGPGSDGETPGHTGKVQRGTYPKETEPFIEAAFAAEIGKLHDNVIEVTVRNKQYFMIFRKDKHHPERQKTFDEEDVRRNVERAAERQKREELMELWLAQLHEQANVKIYSEMIPDTSEEKDTSTDKQAPSTEEGTASE